MPFSRVSEARSGRRAFLLGAAAAFALPARGQAVEYCGPHQPIRDRYESMSGAASALSGAIRRLGPSLAQAVGNVASIDGLLGANSALVSLAPQARNLADAINYFTKASCFREDPTLGISPDYEAVIKQSLGRLTGQLATVYLGGPLGFLVSHAVMEWYIGSLDELYRWRHQPVDFRKIGCFPKEGEDCCRWARPKIPRNFWCAVDVNRPDDPQSVAFSICNEIVEICDPRGRSGIEGAPGQELPPGGGGLGATPNPWGGLPYSPAMGGLGTGLSPPVSQPLPPDADAIAASSAATGGVRDAATSGARRAVREVNPRAMFASVRDLENSGRGSMAAALREAFALLLLYYTLLALVRELLNDALLREDVALGITQVQDKLGPEVFHGSELPSIRR